MPGNAYNNGSLVSNARVARQFREIELRRIQGSPSRIHCNGENREFENPNNEFSGNFDVEHTLHGAKQTSNGQQEVSHGTPTRQRLLVVANRLPVSVVMRGKDSWSLDISVGGLVSALLGVKEIEVRWIGWAGVNVPDEAGQKALTEALAEKRCIPVFLDEEIVEEYYNGYCNNVLWPLFHYLGLPQEERLATTRSFQSQFVAYMKANQMFADVVIKHYKEGDVVWCHDYHLMFLPKYLKGYKRDMKVGWFLHTPFPSSEIYRTLPSRSDLLDAVLAADLVGFHTYDYARHFVSACTRILGLEGTPEGVEDRGRLTRVAAFPIGIDSERFIRTLKDPQVQARIEEYRERFAGKKIMVGVDRLDMIKGIPQKLLAFEKFLEENPEWHHKVVFVQIAVPTRINVHEYQKLTSQVHEIVGRINGRFGTLTSVPIHHLDRSLDFHSLCALYAVTDVAIVTSLRDGMNLVSYEFVACQGSKKGALILSEFAGAAQSLGAGAILVNPWNIIEVSSAIGRALNMPVDERKKRHQHNFGHVTSHTAHQWAEMFISELNDTVIEAQRRIINAPPQLVANDDAIEQFLQSNSRLLILGFNGVLTEAIETPGRRDQIKEMDLKLHSDLKGPLTALCSDPNTKILVISGSNQDVLDDNFKEYDLWLAAEHGMFLRSKGGDWNTTMPDKSNVVGWRDSVKHVIDYFTERTPRSLPEERRTSLLWNYKYTDVEFGRLQARDMLQNLWSGPISNVSVDVVQGNRTIEVRQGGVSKGAAMVPILRHIARSNTVVTPIDYVLCIGHFLDKDEDIFRFFDPGAKSDTTKPASDEKGAGQSTSKDHELNFEKKRSRSKRTSTEKNKNSHLTMLDLTSDRYFSCAVGRGNRNCARYRLNSTDEVVAFLNDLAAAYVAKYSSPLTSQIV